MDIIEKIKEYKQLKEAIEAKRRSDEAALEKDKETCAFFAQLQKDVVAYLSNPTLKSTIENIKKIHADALTIRDGEVVSVSYSSISPLLYNKRNAKEVIFSCKKSLEESIDDLVIGSHSYQAKSCFTALATLKAFVADKAIITLDKPDGGLAALEAKMHVYQEDQLKRELRATLPGAIEAHSVIHLGKKKLKIDPSIISFIRSEFGIEYPNEAPFYLHTTDARPNLFIVKDEKSDATLMRLINNAYFSSLYQAKDVHIQFAGIEASSMHPAILSTLFTKLSSHPFLLFSKQVMNEDPKKIHSLLLALKKEKDERNVSYLDKYHSLEEYNEANPFVKKDYIVVIINGFHTCVRNKEDRELLQEIASGSGRYGIFFIVIGRNETFKEGYSEVKGLYLPDASMGWIPFEDLIPGESLDEETILANAQKQRDKASIFYLDDMLKHYGSAKKKFIDSITVPLGLNYGKIYSLDIDANNAPGGFILGMSRSGKSAFLQTFILSASALYTDEEVIFYLIDFKSGESNTFSQYEKQNHFDDMYVPNVKYLSLSNKPENAGDVLSMIQNKFTERMALFNSVGVDKLSTYNQEMERRGERKLPLMIVIIDEFNAFLDADSSSLDRVSTISNKVGNLLRTVASGGIKIFFSGQNPALRNDETSQIIYRICFDPGADSYHKTFSALYGSEFALERDEDYRRNMMGRKGFAYIENQANSLHKPAFVRTSFAGEMSSEMIRATARRIRSNYSKEYLDSCEQLIAGSNSEAKLTQVHLNQNDSKAHTGALYPIGLCTADQSLYSLAYGLGDKGKILVGSNCEKMFRFENLLIANMLQQNAEEIVYGGFIIDEDFAANEKLHLLKKSHSEYANALTILEEGEELAENIALELGQRILALHKRFKQRKIRRDRSRSILGLVIHNVSLLDIFDDLMEGVKENSETKKPAASAMPKKAFPSFEQVLEKDPTMTLEKYQRLAARYAAMNPEVVEEVSEPLEIPTRREVLACLKELYDEGASVGIHVLLVDLKQDAKFLDEVANDTSRIERESLSDSLIYMGDPSEQENVFYFAPFTKVSLFALNEETITLLETNRK